MIKIRKRSKLFSLAIVFAFIFVIVSEVPVFASTIKVVDNDDAQGHTVASYGTWSYLSANSLYYADARISASGNKNHYYRYVFDHYIKVIGSTTLKLRAYLNHPDFTELTAKYRILYNGGVEYYAYRDQNNAPPGWNIVLNNIPVGSSGNTYYYTGAEVHPSQNTGYSTGADAIEVTIY